MLINQNTYSEGDVVTFKLTNGDELVGKLVEDTALEFRIDRPCTVVPSQKGIMLIASLFTASPDIKVSISKSHVLLHAPTAKEVQDYYIQVTTGIKPVSAGSIVTGL